jgi:hypothetical protein
VRIHEDMWLKLAHDKAVEMRRDAATQRMVREAQGPLLYALRRRAARVLRAAARRLSREVGSAGACSAPLQCPAIGKKVR